MVRYNQFSIRENDYPASLVDIHVVADNCTDDTAAICRQAGAYVVERFNQVQKGKGYALNHLYKRIVATKGSDYYDGYFVFDADNLLDKRYITEMDKCFAQGHRIITSYRNSKNYGKNWISSGYSLWFLREAAYLNRPRFMLNTSCAISIHSLFARVEWKPITHSVAIHLDDLDQASA